MASVEAVRPNDQRQGLERVRQWLDTARQIFFPRVRYSERLYPEGILYKLNHGGAQLDSKDLESLINNNFSREFLYLGAKALASEPEKQRHFLQSVLATFLQESANHTARMEKLDQLRQTFLSNVEIPAAKLSQISHHEFDEWRKELTKLVTDCFQENPNALPVLITHVPLYALPDYIPLYRQAGHRAIFIIADKWLPKENIDFAGYEIDITTDPPEVKLMTKDEVIQFKDQPLFLLDDTIKSGDTIQGVKNFLSQRGHVPDSQMIPKAITDLRTHS